MSIRLRLPHAVTNIRIPTDSPASQREGRGGSPSPDITTPEDDTWVESSEHLYAALNHRTGSDPPADASTHQEQPSSREGVINAAAHCFVATEERELTPRTIPDPP